MKLKPGKFYRTRDGQAVGPLVLGNDPNYPFFEASALRKDGSTMTVSWSPDGRFLFRSISHRLDIVDELWESDGPVRQVTKLEIVPGVYGHRGEITIGKAGTCTMVQVEINAPMSKNHLRKAARIFNQIADALENKT